MKSQWHSHLSNKDDKEKFKLYLQSNKDLFRRLDTILDKITEEELSGSIGLEDFDKPNWAEKQAYRNGKLAALKNIKTLLEGLTD